jgi:hypothetical protein
VGEHRALDIGIPKKRNPLETGHSFLEQLTDVLARDSAHDPFCCMSHGHVSRRRTTA